MAKINDFSDFQKIIDNITNFSHAYLFSVNSLDLAYPYIKEFAKSIILEQNNDEEEKKIINYQIDHDEYDDLYVVNPITIGINTDEINKLMTYMETKSLRPNGRRVYIIYGFERLSRDVSNKILKFLEEPSENIYALLLTENFERILPTIVSRCQKIDLMLDNLVVDEEKVALLQSFLNHIITDKTKTIAYEYEYFGDVLSNRNQFYQYFVILERIISVTLNKKYDFVDSNVYVCDSLLEFSNVALVNILDITNQLKCLIKENINLNLLLDRYIIEITEELELCKK